MDCDYLTLTNSGIQKIQPYQPGKPISELQRELGLRDIIKLASNENPLGPSPKAIAAIQQALPEITRYPDGSGFDLKRKLTQHLNITTEQLTLGNGSNDNLVMIAQLFANSKAEVIIPQYAFAIYFIVSQMMNAKIHIIPAKQWGCDLAAMAKAINANTRLIFLANPNNPTGTWIASDGLKAFIDKVPKHVIVVIDEAYHEYIAENSDYVSALNWLHEYPNLIVTRTFSKAYGLAGLRVGYSVSHPDIADLLNRIRQAFNVNNLAQVAATISLDDITYLQKSIAVNKQGMQQLVAGFKQLKLTYIPSRGNFISVAVNEDANTMFTKLLQKGIITRPLEGYQMPQYLRISIGLPEENAKLLAALRDVIT